LGFQKDLYFAEKSRSLALDLLFTLSDRPEFPAFVFSSRIRTAMTDFPEGREKLVVLRSFAPHRYVTMRRKKFDEMAFQVLLALNRVGLVRDVQYLILEQMWRDFFDSVRL
jgi:hypothetical protein